MKCYYSLFLVSLVTIAGFSIPLHAEQPSSATPIEQVVDFYIDQQLKEEKITPSGSADDATIIRRLTLDLIGRIPTPAETASYVSSNAPDKLKLKVESLLASPAFSRHLGNDLNTMLMAGNPGSIRDYLVKSIQARQSWDQIYRTLMTPDEANADQKGASDFLKQRLSDGDKLTSDISSLFFGVNMSCARCHDHPLVQDWKQDHFYGMKSFVARTFDNGGSLAEHDIGLVKFKTTKGVEKKAQMMFITGKVIDHPSIREPKDDDLKKEKELIEKHKKDKTQLPTPAFSSRKTLVEVSLQKEQRDFFARSIVNRMWYRMFGTGLVMPLDQMHSENPPSHPELLEWLARDMADHGYDIRRLIRGLVLSKAYSRSSKWTGGSERPIPSLFAVAPVKALTPMQLAVSLKIASTDPDRFSKGKPEEIEKTIDGIEQNARGFADLIEQPTEDFQIGVGEALLFSNNDRPFQEFLAEGGDKLVSRLTKAKSPRETVELAVRSILCRNPDPEELNALEKFLSQRQARNLEACRQVVWALLTSPEFRFNH